MYGSQPWNVIKQISKRLPATELSWMNVANHRTARVTNNEYFNCVNQITTLFTNVKDIQVKLVLISGWGQSNHNIVYFPIADK